MAKPIDVSLPSQMGTPSPAIATESDKVAPSSNIRAVQGSNTLGLRAPINKTQQADTALINRKVTVVEPTRSYLGQLYGALDTGITVAKAFTSDFCTTTATTLNSAWHSLDQGIPEVIKFGTGLIGLGAGLTQAATAGISEMVEGSGYPVANTFIDGVTPLLKVLGVDAVNLNKTELRQLGVSVAGLSLGIAQDISLNSGQFQMKQKDGSQLSINDINLKKLKSVGDQATEYQKNTVSPQRPKNYLSVLSMLFPELLLQS